MDSDREQHDGRVPLPGFGAPAPDDEPAPDRRDGIRHVRRMSNWTLAALMAGTGAATVALAHHSFPTATTAGTATTAAGATAGTGTTAGPAAHGASGPQVTHSVATTSGSGVTMTTTTHTVNGKIIVTHVRHVAAYHDN
jgi:hypothetical protein